MNKMFYLLFGFMFLVGTAVSVGAQEMDETEIAFGVVKMVDENSITVVDAEENLEIVLTVNAETILENVESLEALHEGDSVYVDYVIVDNINVALNVYKAVLDEDYSETISDITAEEDYVGSDHE